MADTSGDRPVMNRSKRAPYRQRPYTAGGPQGDLSARKNDLLDSGPGTGYVPGHSGTGRRSSAQAGHVSEAPPSGPSGPVPGMDDLEVGGTRRPMPREIEVHTQTSHFGSITRYLDGHSEIHRERPGLVAHLHDPELADYHDDIRAEIAHRDSVHNHKFW